MRPHCLAIILLVASSAAPQELPCNRAIPVNVVLPNGGLIRRLPGDGFVAQDKKEPIRIQSVTTDTGPRRIVFVAEDGKPMPKAARKIESEVILDILSKARAEDSFALVSARGPEEKVQFGASRDAVKAAAQELENQPKGKNREEGVLDALLEATTWLQPPRPGDSIVLITMGLESPHEAGFSKVRRALADGRIRVFGFLLGQLVAGYSSPTPINVTLATGGMFMPTDGISLNRENVFALALSSGGVVSQENTDSPFREYKLTDDRLRSLEHSGEQMYKAITEYYLVDLASPSPDLVIDLAAPIRSQLPKATVLYPRLLPDCPAGAKGGSNP